MLLSFIIYNFSKLTTFLIAYTIKKLLETRIIFVCGYIDNFMCLQDDLFHFYP